jgi:hypothetical protein
MKFINESTFSLRIRFRSPGFPLRVHFQFLPSGVVLAEDVHVLLGPVGRAAVEDLVHAFIVVAVELILLLQGLLEADLRLVEVAEEPVHFLVELLVPLGREQVHEVVVDLLAQLGRRLVVAVLAVEDVPQHRGRVLPAVEGVLQRERLVQLVQ